MTTVAINLNEVVERPKLPAAQPFEFAIIKADLAISKTPNKHTGIQEPVVKCQLAPTDPQWSDRIVYQNWSLAPRALSSDDPLFSIKKFFAVIGFTWNDDGSFSTEDLLTVRFVGTVAYPDKFAELATINRGV